MARKQKPKISIAYAEGKPFHIKANPALRKHMHMEMEDSWEDREGLLREMLSSHGFALLDGDLVDIGLTSAPFISDRWPDGRDLPEGARVWWFERYQIDDFTETLRDYGEVSFPWGMVVEYEREELPEDHPHFKETVRRCPLTLEIDFGTEARA